MYRSPATACPQRQPVSFAQMLEAGRLTLDRYNSVRQREPNMLRMFPDLKPQFEDPS